MDCWSPDSEERSPSLFHHNIDLSLSALTQKRKLLPNWGMNPCSSLDNNIMLVPHGEDDTETMDSCVPEMMTKTLPSTANLGGVNGNFSSKVVLPSCSSLTSNSLFGEFDSTPRVSSSFVDSYNQGPSLVDLTLGKYGDLRGMKERKFSKEISVLSSVGSSSLAKRSRMAVVNSQSPVCQVHGCGKDLSSSKDYHKRHKVCDAHSKTSMVIVNGIEQRFCQQCSRFHLLKEFDDGKRSCRKRLAGHNERRRKLQLDAADFGKPHKLLHYYQSTRFLGPSLEKRTSFVVPDIHNGGNFREEPTNSQLATTVANRRSLPKPVLHFHGMGKQNPSITFSLKNDYTAFDTGSTVKESSRVSNSSRALSLLSAQSQNMSSYSPSNNPFGCCSSRMNSSVEVGQLGSSMISDAGYSVDFGAHIDGICQRSDSMKSQFSVSPGNSPLVDLRQLSSHLQKVEQHRNSVLVKKENGISYSYQTT